MRIDPDNVARVPVQSPRTPVVASELPPVPGAKLLLDLHERLCLVAAPSDGRPGDGLALRRGKQDRAHLGVDCLDPVGAASAQLLFATAAPERDDLAGCLAGGLGRFGAGQPQRFQCGRHDSLGPQRAIADQLCADDIGKALAAFAGRVEHEGPEAVCGR